MTDLEHYLRTERLPCHSTVAVGGIKVDRAYGLGHGMQIVPWKDVLNSRTKRAVDEVETFHRSFYDPDCALLRAVDLPRVHVDYTARTGGDVNNRNRALRRKAGRAAVFPAMRDVVREVDQGWRCS